MSWGKKFGEPIRLKDGRQLRRFLRRVPSSSPWKAESRVPYYEYAIELLLKAAETGKKADVVEAEKSDAPRAQGRRILN